MSEQAAKLRRIAERLRTGYPHQTVNDEIAAELEALASEPSPVVGEDAGPVYVAEPARKESPEEAALFRVRSNLPSPAAMIPVAQVGARKAKKSVWSEARELQIDSYATDRHICHAYVKDGNVVIALTDGREEWTGTISLPPEYQP